MLEGSGGLSGQRADLKLVQAIVSIKTDAIFSSDA